MTDREKPEDEPVVLTDPRDIRALAHPARLAVLTELEPGVELTATELAARAGVTPSAMSTSPDPRTSTCVWRRSGARLASPRVKSRPESRKGTPRPSE